MASKQKMEHATQAMTQVLEFMGIDLTDENFKGTPERYVRFLQEFTQGEKDVEKHLSKTFPVTTDFPGMVVQSNIPYRALCAHHLAPVIGRVHIAYVPGEREVGLSKITRLVHAVSNAKPSLQEDVTERIANLMQLHLKPAGVAIIIEAEHTCMACRGIREAGIITSTSAIRGVFRDVPAAREEFRALIGTRRNL